jgi:hypothetical protein
MEIAVKMAEMSSEGRGRRRRRRHGGLPRHRHHGGASPLSLLPSWLHGSPPPWRWDPWGGESVALVAANSWVEVSSTS